MYTIYNQPIEVIVERVPGTVSVAVEPQGRVVTMSPDGAEIVANSLLAAAKNARKPPGKHIIGVRNKGKHPYIIEIPHAERVVESGGERKVRWEGRGTLLAATGECDKPGHEDFYSLAETVFNITTID